MRKSFKIAPGVRLNVSKTGVGASVGGQGGRYSVHSSGRRTVTAGSGIIPGVYYQQSVGGESGSRVHSNAPPVANPPKPGLFAPKGEKELYNALKAQDIPAIKAVGVTYPEYRVCSYSLVGLLLLSDDTPQAKRLLTMVFDSGRDPAADPFISKYQWQAWRALINIAVGVTTELPINRDAVGLALAEIRQRDGDLAGAIDVVEQLEPSAYAAVSLAELYSETGRLDDVIELTNGLTNEDDATALLLVFRGAALREQGFNDAAHEAFKEALRSRSRSAAIRHFALSERAANYLAQGKNGMARKDLERILAEDSDYERVRERLTELERAN
jgi:tetratricopeptide (TPR) repeat protein